MKAMITPIRAGLAMALLCLAFGMAVGVSFGLNEDMYVRHVAAGIAAHPALHDAISQAAIVHWALRAHFHATGVGAFVLALVVLTLFADMSAARKRVASTLAGLGCLYPPTWLIMFWVGPELGRKAAHDHWLVQGLTYVAVAGLAAAMVMLASSLFGPARTATERGGVTSALRPVRGGLALILLCLAFGIGVGLSFGINGDLYRHHVAAGIAAHPQLHDAASQTAIVRWALRAHFHATGISAFALVLIGITALSDLRAPVKRGIALLIGLGACYPLAWLTMFWVGPELGRAAAHEYWLVQLFTYVGVGGLALGTALLAAGLLRTSMRKALASGSRFVTGMATVRVGMAMVLACLAFGIAMGVSFGVAEDVYLRHVVDGIAAHPALHDAGSRAAIMRWALRAHFHATGIGAFALGLLVLTMYSDMSAAAKRFTGLAIGLGGCYPLAWLTMFWVGPELGRPAAHDYWLTQLLTWVGAGGLALGLAVLAAHVLAGSRRVAAAREA